MIDLLCSFFGGLLFSYVIYQKKCAEQKRSHEALSLKLQAEKKRYQTLNSELESYKSDQSQNLFQLEEKLLFMEKQLLHANKHVEQLSHRVETLKMAHDKEKSDWLQEKQRLYNLSEEELYEELKQEVLKKKETALFHASRALEENNLLEIKERSQRLLIESMQRISVDCTSEATVSSISLPAEEIKRKIVGKEGRNIKTFEELTGTTLLVDDSPFECRISCFDPIRRECARQTLLSLINLGKIYPVTIHQCYERAQEQLEERLIKEGDRACSIVGVGKLHYELIKLLGKLHFRYSFGQNVLKHSIEVALLMEVLAEELELNAALAIRIGLLHDIGKTVTSPEDSARGLSHARSGAKMARKFGECETVANGIESHHQETLARSLEAKLLEIADTISASRPGARQEWLSMHIKRMTALEKRAQAVEGIEKAYILQAGKEMIVTVCPTKVKEERIHSLIEELRCALSKDHRFSSPFKLTVKRENTFVDYIT